jgi:hypothetical protein
MMSDSDFSRGAGMNRRREGAESRFTAFVEGLTSVIGHADRAKPLHDYCTGLVMPCERKSVEPMAAVTAPARVGAQHQSLLHFVGEALGQQDDPNAFWAPSRAKPLHLFNNIQTFGLFRSDDVPSASICEFKSGHCALCPYNRRLGKSMTAAGGGTTPQV